MSTPSTPTKQKSFQQYSDSEALLTSLSNFIRTNEKGLKTGETALNLNPACLEYLNSFINGKSISHKLTKQDLLSLQTIMSQVRLLQMDSNLPETLEKYRDLDMNLFGSLSAVQFNYVKPGLVTNLCQIAKTLTKVAVHQSLYSLDELLVVEDEAKLTHFQEISVKTYDDLVADKAEIPHKRLQELYVRNGIWSNLVSLDCSSNYIPKIDSSMYTLVSLEKLNLEGNLISKVENLHECLNLRVLNLSNNRITSMENIYEVLGLVTHLSLSGNMLTNVDGLNKLYGLEYLDITMNQIRDIEEISKFKQMPSLRCLNVKGNPLCQFKSYRGCILYSLLGEDVQSLEFKEFYLDGIAIGQADIDFIKKNTSTMVKDLSLTPQKSSTNRIKPMKEDESLPPLTFAPSVLKAKGENSTSPALLSTSVPKPYQRTVDLEEAPEVPEYTTGMTDTSEQDNFIEEKNLRKRIEELREEGGNAWLRILNEMDVQANNNNSNINKRDSLTKQMSDSLVTHERRVIKKKVKKTILKPKNPAAATTTQTTPISITPDSSSTPLDQTPTTSTPLSSTPTSMPTTPIKPLDTPVSTPTKPKQQQFDEPVPTPPTTSTPTPTSISSSPPSTASPSSLKDTLADPSPSVSHEIPKVKSAKEEPATASPKLATISTRPKSEFITKSALSSILSQDQPADSTRTVNNNPLSLLEASLKQANLNDSRLLAEPFFVLKFGTNQEMLLEIKSDLITETNPATGTSIKSHLIQAVVFVRKYSRPPHHLIEISYGKDFKDSVPMNFFKEVYIMEDEDQAVLLMTILTPLVKEYTMSCLDCSERYICRDENQFGQCIRCHSKYLFFVPVLNIDQQQQQQQQQKNVSQSYSAMQLGTSLPPVATIPMTSAQHQQQAKPEVSLNEDDDFNQSILDDQNLQLKLRMNLFTGGSQEVYIYMMQTNYIQYNSQDDERTIYLLLTSKTVYMLKKEKKSLLGQDNNYTRLTSFQFKDIKTMDIGLLFQSFRIELENDVCYVFLKRSHDPTHKFLDLLVETAKKDGVNLEPNYRIKETMINIACCIESKNDFELYIMLYFKSFSKYQPRSLIITTERIFICVENYSQWPLSSRQNIKLLTPQFLLVGFFRVVDISCLHYSVSKPTELIIEFDLEDESTQQWSLQTAHPVECKKIVTTLSKLWKKKFLQDLPVNDR
ncbi:hypothetical protein SAMD00019534_122680 [Acytostelium subglobosum LB1]|uniref:hypothetical protein n=1 Tax=Acytostelium subglobosum LB1 TaxID=1410327 RepID=UPI000644DFD3|nr:hypothetical protein SAMD00019534_122680 [Acytostelium subglobosum LB1]GAM29092.1 hypothetical protein SAMD00019534_122680 [Acytostelium subglobosum LB1]|eukprot:XP_012747937.1 hypothetical protein SAMD00019534_122680 [Acytostelium subglobosum LB1]